jgi:hypothetical protein
MRIRSVRISGFKSIPFCAQVEPGAATGRRGALCITWARDAFQVDLPTTPRPGRPLLAAIMGPNSAGKSNVLLALDYFFSSAVKLDAGLYNGKQTDRPLIVEVTLEGALEHPTQWHTAHCQPHGSGYRLTLASVWCDEGRTRYIRRGDGIYVRQTQQDRSQCDRLLPEFRVIWADRHLSDEARLERRSLLGDVLEALVARAGPEPSIIGRIAALVGELEQLVADREQTDLWQPVFDLEASLTRGLAAITPQRKAVRLRLEQAVPTLRGLFAQGMMSLDDGVELDFAQHGLGVQRSLSVAALNTWCEYLRADGRDYLFAIEEPEIYLHPHATRVLLNLLEKVAQRDQVIFTTHAGEFVNRVPLDQIVTVQRRDGCNGVQSHAVRPSLAGLPRDEVTKVQRYLREERSDMLFARAVLLVEGQAEYFSLPAFARTLELDLDAGGVSVVFVNGIGNFVTYHAILQAFQIPHAVLMDGDGEAAARRSTYRHLADALLVLERDFEQLLVEALTPARLLALMNLCLAHKNKPARAHLADLRQRGKELAALGKPLVGRVAGEMLTRAEVERMPILVEALRSILHLGGALTEP